MDSNYRAEAFETNKKEVQAIIIIIIILRVIFSHKSNKNNIKKYTWEAKTNPIPTATSNLFERLNALPSNICNYDNNILRPKMSLRYTELLIKS